MIAWTHQLHRLHHLQWNKGCNCKCGHVFANHTAGHLQYSSLILCSHAQHACLLSSTDFNKFAFCMVDPSGTHYCSATKSILRPLRYTVLSVSALTPIICFRSWLQPNNIALAMTFFLRSWDAPARALLKSNAFDVLDLQALAPSDVSADSAGLNSCFGPKSYPKVYPFRQEG